MKKKTANPAWWGTVEEDFNVDPNACLPVQDILTEFDEMIGVQCSDGNWNADPYMHGMANGMLYMKSLIDGQDPDFMEAPEVWLDDVRPGGPPEACYQDDLGNEVCEGEPQIEDSSLALVPFEEAAEEDYLEADDAKVYFTAAARSRGLNFEYPKAKETWVKHRRKNSGRLPFKKVKRTEDNPTIVETCGRNYILPECRDDYEKGFNALATALAHFVQAATIPYEEVEVAEWNVVSTENNPVEDMELYGEGPYEDIREKPVFEGWEGNTVLRTNMSGVDFTIRLDWFLYPNYKGPDDLDLQSVDVLEGPNLKVESHDGTIMPISEWFRNEMPSLLWDYDLAREIFPMEEDFEDVSKYDYDEPPMMRNLSSREERPIRGAAIGGPVTEEELLSAPWEITDCGYDEEGSLSYNKYGPALDITHYRGRTVVQGVIRGKTVSLVMEWFTSGGSSKAMRKQWDRKNKKPIPSGLRRQYEESGEYPWEEPEDYFKDLEYEIENWELSGAEALDNLGPVDTYESVQDWIEDHPYEILDTFPTNEAFCGIE